MVKSGFQVALMIFSRPWGGFGGVQGTFGHNNPECQVSQRIVGYNEKENDQKSQNGWKDNQ